MNDTERFNKWVSERMGHPLGVYLGINAVNELTEENKKLKQDRDNAISKMSKSWQHNSDDRPSLISDFVDMANRQFEENKQLREERERLEAAYDLYCVWVGDRVGQHAIDFNEWKVIPDYYKKWLRIVDKTNYRKEE